MASISVSESGGPLIVAMFVALVIIMAEEYKLVGVDAAEVEDTASSSDTPAPSCRITQLRRYLQR